MVDSERQLMDEESLLKLFLSKAIFPGLQLVILIPRHDELQDVCRRLSNLASQDKTLSVMRRTQNILQLENGSTIRLVSGSLFARGIRIDALAVCNRLSDQQEKEARMNLYPALRNHSNLYYFT